jgi:8-hydroxy-5-deazaflavin:NADPH oxidoreductase
MRPAGPRLVVAMKIGVLGTGMVGPTLARGLAGHGHDVRIGTRDPNKPEVADFAPASAVEVAGWADLIVLAVAGTAAEALAGEVAEVAAGKVLVDATNPLDFSGGGPGLFVAGRDSLGERVQRAAPAARVVKAYNTVGNAHMVDPDLPGGPPTMLIAGDDEAAKRSVTELLQSTGWDVADLGSIEACRVLEPFALAWVTYAIRTGTRDHAFKLLRG